MNGTQGEKLTPLIRSPGLQSIELTAVWTPLRSDLGPGRLLVAIQVYSHGISGLATRSPLLLHQRHSVC